MTTQNNKKQAKETVETEAWFKDLVEQARDLVQCVNSEGRFVYVNKAWLATLKYSHEEIDSITLWDIIHPDSMEHCMAVFKHVLTGKAYGEVEAVFTAKDGTLVMVEGNVSVKLDENGCFVHTRGIFRDVTERKRAEEAIRESEERFRSIIAVSNTGAWEYHRKNDYLWCSPEYFTMLGRNPDDFTMNGQANLKETWLDLLHPEDREKAGQTFADYLRKGPVGMYENHFRLRHADGSWVWIWSRGKTLHNQDGSLTDKTVGTHINITDRKHVEEELQKFKVAVEQSIAGVAMSDMSGNIYFINKAWAEMHGYSTEEVIGCHLSIFHTPEQMEKEVIPSMKRLLQDDSFHSERGHLRKDGTTFTAHMTSSVVKGVSGEPFGMIAIISDITDRKRAEEALKTSEQKYREILSTIEEGYYEVDLNGNFVFFNDPFCEATGYSRDELMQGSYKIFYKDPQEVFSAYNRVYQTGLAEKAFGWPVITKDGREIYVEVSITLRRNEAGEPIGFRGIARDVTERKQAEEKLREYEKLQQLLMSLATECINVPLEQVDNTVNKMLKAVGEFTQVDRVYIFKHDYSRRVTSNTHEWCADGIPPEIDNLQDFPFEHFIDFLETNQKGDIVHIPDVTSLPANHSMRSLFADQGIQSMIMLPLFSEEVNSGFVGFDVVKKKKVFTEQEINLLKVLAEITANVLSRQKAEINIRYMSFHDKLTGLYNRTFLEEEMKRLDTERQLLLTIIMADLNGLKLVNDTYGHKKGDEMLKAAAAIIESSCREEDIISRWGGDEFVILLPQTTSDEANLICKRITESCRNAFVEDVPLSIALGMATKDVKAKELMDTLREAEDEMYKRKLTESRSTKSTMVTSLLYTLAEKSYETEKHTRGMQKVAQKIGAKLNLPDSELHRLELLITLHDIGKINISEDILTKEGSLTDDEWEAIKKHPEIGYRIAMATEEFAHVAEDILAHHERWDGSGYPQGLKGEAIPLLARITAIADAYEVMSNGRPYKKALSKSEILAEFKNCSSTHFDPKLVEIFLSIMEA